MEDKQFTEIRKLLEEISMGLRAKTTRQWLIDYYNSVNEIPNYFTAEEWEETEKRIYDYIVKEINESFRARRMYHSGMRRETLAVVDKEREKLFKAKIRQRKSKSKPE